MTPLQKNIVIGVGVVFLAVAGYKWMAEPTSYEDCILKNMADAQNERAASYVKEACRDKDYRSAASVVAREVYHKVNPPPQSTEPAGNVFAGQDVSKDNPFEKFLD